MRSCAAQHVVPVEHAQGQVLQPASATKVRHAPATQTWFSAQTLPHVPQL